MSVFVNVVVKLHLMLAFLLASMDVHAADTTEFKSGVFDPPRMAPDFSLPGSHGSDFILSEQRGKKLVILGFGFSHCPDICPMTLANLAQARKKLGALAEEIQVIYVTVDPERDSVKRLQEYMMNFHSSFIGLTGSPEQLAAVRKEYGILAAKEVHKDGSYEVHHSSYVYLIDHQGLLRALVPFGKTADDIVHDVKILLQQNAERTAL